MFIHDFSGSAMSDGEYVSLGIFESVDLETIVKYLRTCGKVSKIALWGRSMGSVASIIYASRDVFFIFTFFIFF